MQRQQTLLLEEFNNLRILKIIPNMENKSISMQNLRAKGGGWLDHTGQFQALLETALYGPAYCLLLR